MDDFTYQLLTTKESERFPEGEEKHFVNTETGELALAIAPLFLPEGKNWVSISKTAYQKLEK